MCQVSVAATEQCLPEVQESVRHWLAGLEWPEDPAEDIVLAVHEAVSNAVEHAYPDGTDVGMVDVQGVEQPAFPGGTRDGDRSGAPTERRRQVRMSVRDHGVWQPDQHDRTDPARLRGRGLTMMQALMSEMTITASAEDGTEVELLSKPVC